MHPPSARLPLALVFATALAGAVLPAHSQGKETKTFVSGPYGDRTEACASVKRDAQFWVDLQTRQDLSSQLANGKKTLAGYSNCDCGSQPSGAGTQWKCTVDATIDIRK